MAPQRARMRVRQARDTAAGLASGAAACEKRASRRTAVALLAPNAYKERPNSGADALRKRLPRRNPRPRADLLGHRRARVVGPQEDQCAARRLLGLLSLPRREDRRPFTARTRRAATTVSAAACPATISASSTELDGMSFPEAVERHRRRWPACRCRRATEADEARPGARQPDRRHGTRRRRSSRSSCSRRAGAKARAYLRDRGLSPATQQAFRLGYAPDSRNALKEFLAGKGVTKAADGGLRADRPRRRHSGFLRPLPRPHHVPDPRFRGTRHRLRRARAVLRRAGQISELAGDRALPQGQRALQLRARPQGQSRRTAR